jgi:signal transduction histidine kinase
VALTLDTPPDRLVIRVRDHGPGIAEENLLHVFDMYFSRGTRDGSGMGLGLPLSRRLARLLGGELSAANHPEGGAVFTLELPLNDRK